MGFDSKCDFAPPTILLGLLLCPWMWGISSKSSSAAQPQLQFLPSCWGFSALGSGVYKYDFVQFLFFDVYECMLNRFAHVQLFVTLWTVAYQAPLSMGFSRQEYWNELPCPPPGDLPDPGIEPAFPVPPEFQLDSLLLSHQGSPLVCLHTYLIYIYIIQTYIHKYIWVCMF